MTPTNIGRYQIKSELGRGGMAIVYLANDPRFDREVAVKVLPREFLFDDQFRVRFEREIKMVAQLEHPAIVPVYDVGEEDGQPYFVMRNMTGGSLSDWLKQGAFSLKDTARIVERLSKALAYAHKKGVVHRDLKPGNILFDGNGEAFISDFGVAKLAEAASTMTGSGVIGTPAYMSPEQAQSGQVDGRSDVYAMGAIIFEMLTGQQPYKADTPMGLVIKHITEPVPNILQGHPEFPPELDGVIKKAMSKDSEQRYPNMLELAKSLNKVAFGEEGHLTEFQATRPNIPAPVIVPPSSVAPTVAPNITPSGTPKVTEARSVGFNKNWIWIGGLAGACMLLTLAVAAIFLLRGGLASPTSVPTLVEEASQTPVVATETPLLPTYTVVVPELLSATPTLTDVAVPQATARPNTRLIEFDISESGNNCKANTYYFYGTGGDIISLMLHKSSKIESYFSLLSKDRETLSTCTFSTSYDCSINTFTLPYTGIYYVNVESTGCRGGLVGGTQPFTLLLSKQ